MKNISLPAGVISLLAVAAALPAYAQDRRAPAPDAAAVPVVSDDAAPTPDGDTVVVTALRAPTAIDTVPAAVTVLDKAAIDRAADLSVADLLVRTPGVSLSRNGGYGTVTTLRIRGAEGDQTALVVDGVRLNDPSSPGGGYDFANLLVGDASRIEVLRGPQSILWGSQAIGGVVNVVTPLPARALESNIDVEAGSRDTVSGRAAVGGRTGPVAWRVGGQALTTDGISALSSGTERDGFSQRNAAARALVDVTTGLAIDLRGYYSDGRVDLDGFAGDSDEFQTTEQFVGYAGVNLDLFDGRFRNRVGYAYTDIARDNYDPALGDETFVSVGRNTRIEYQGSLAIADRATGVFGFDHEVSRFRSFSPAFSFGAAPDRGRARLDGFYGNLSVEPIDRLTLSGGVRLDDHSRFGSATVFQGGAVWVLPTETVLRASYGEGFKAPTLYQLFSEFGNEALAPERAKGWEVGAEQRFLDGQVALGGTYFERRTRNLIGYNGCDFPTSTDPLCTSPITGQPRFGYYLNTARAFARGVEATGRVALGTRFSLDGDYSWILSEDRSDESATFGRQLPRRPRHAWNVAASYTVPDGPGVSAAVRRSGATFDNAFAPTPLAGYTLVDLRAELPVSPTVRVFVRGENVFDEGYETAAGFGTLGRSIYAGLRGRF